MMDILMSESCWAHKKWNKIASDIKLVFHSSAIQVYHRLTPQIFAAMLSAEMRNWSTAHKTRDAGTAGRVVRIWNCAGQICRRCGFNATVPGLPGPRNRSRHAEHGFRRFYQISMAWPIVAHQAAHLWCPPAHRVVVMRYSSSDLRLTTSNECASLSEGQTAAQFCVFIRYYKQCGSKRQPYKL